MAEKALIIGFHLYLLLFATAICWRSTARRSFIVIVLGSFITGTAWLKFFDLYARINPSNPEKIADHLYAIIGYAILITLVSNITKRKKEEKKGHTYFT